MNQATGLQHDMSRSIRIMRKIFFTLFIIIPFCEPAPAQSPEASPSPALVVDSLAGEVHVLATFHPKKFFGALEGLLRVVPQYHFLVWDDGRASHEALFVTSVSDAEVVAALEKIGGRPGNNLTMEAWDKRYDANHPAPQTRIAGTPVTISIIWKDGREEINISELLNDSDGKGFDFRFGGNMSMAHEWHSGCVVCLYSCPGSKVGNAAYTVRDYVTNQRRFTLQKKKWPPTGTPATIIFRVQR